MVPGLMCSTSPSMEEALLWWHPVQLGQLGSALWQTTAKAMRSKFHREKPGSISPVCRR